MSRPKIGLHNKRVKNGQKNLCIIEQMAPPETDGVHLSHYRAYGSRTRQFAK